ncbi:MAG: NADH-quinone oxidoreductase subunit NuoE [Abditibacteriales bacterium]|nr:NADH-quinone oxidoreductase subunit NuoE [Abditibacteriales bacterium]MDW8365766.1 NADH-quinone oxidoreductase subunit NuoE [Abditibacteriales bacterium]
MSLSDEARQKIQEIAARYPRRISATIPALYVAQAEYGGWLPKEAMVEVAEELDVPPSHVFGVATFYTLFYKEPVGKHVVQLCTNLACMLCGAETLQQHLERKFNIKINGSIRDGTTADGTFTVLPVECLAACGGAPCMIVDTEYYENLTIEKVDKILTQIATQPTVFFKP